MKFLLSLVLTAIASYVGGMFLPWWSMAIIAFIISLIIYQSAGKSFLAGFLSIFILWAVLAFIIDQQNNSILSKKIAQILPLGGFTTLLILVTALLGGLIAGLSALSASLLIQGKNPKVKS